VERFLLASLAILLLIAAVSDFRRYTIPNWLSLAILALFVVRTVFNAPPFPLLVLDLLGAALIFAIGFILFFKGMFGGGDVKLLSSVALWVGFVNLPRFLLTTTLAGGLLALLLILIRWTRSRDGRVHDQRVPYGIAIAIAGIDYCVVQANLAFW